MSVATEAIAVAVHPRSRSAKHQGKLHGNAEILTPHEIGPVKYTLGQKDVWPANSVPPATTPAIFGLKPLSSP